MFDIILLTLQAAKRLRQQRYEKLNNCEDFMLCEPCNHGLEQSQHNGEYFATRELTLLDQSSCASWRRCVKNLEENNALNCEAGRPTNMFMFTAERLRTQSTRVSFDERSEKNTSSSNGSRWRDRLETSNVTPPPACANRERSDDRSFYHQFRQKLAV